MPANDALDAVHVLEELPQKPGLAGAGLADHRHEPCAALLGAVLERIRHARQLALTADERRLEPGAAPGAAGARHDPQRGPRPDGLLAALDLVLAGVLVGDRGL